MNKRKIFIVLAALAVLFLTANNVLADLSFQFYPVNGIGGTETHEFYVGQTPYLYVNLEGLLPAEGFDLFNTTISTDWYLGSTLEGSAGREGLNQVGFQFSSLEWGSIGKPGTWNIYGNFSIEDLDTGAVISLTPSTSFTVKAVPEPVSTFLFVSGAAVLSLRRMSKNRK